MKSRLAELNMRYFNSANGLYYFGRSGYYRFYRKESLLNPKDQAFVRQTFRRYGITSEPAYDGFVDKYAWW